MDPERSRLVEHVSDVQRTIRTCEGCGLCCTDAHNSVRILPVEGDRVARHLRTLSDSRRDALAARLRAAVDKYELRLTGKAPRYTCPFLEADMSCALPFDVKPVACLAFNPRTPDDCSMENKWFASAHRAAERANAAEGWPDRRVPIPVAVLAALQERIPRVPKSVAAEAPRRAKPETTPIFLPRILSKWHVASRKQAEAMVRAGRVSVNGLIRTDILFKVKPAYDKIAVDGAAVGAPDPASAFVYVAANKPRGMVTTTHDPEGRATVMDLVAKPAPAGLAPVGRLDQDSAGLLILTNDHDLADRLLSPASHVRKGYRVKVRGHPTDETLTRLRTQTMTVDGMTFAPIEIVVADASNPRSTWLQVTLREGKNRQIRRQFAAVGHDVEVLIRTDFGPITLAELAPGESRPLTPDEIEGLRAGAPPAVSASLQPRR